MFIRIAVFDPLPVYRRGVLAILGDAGFDADTPDDLLAWLRSEERRLVLLTMVSPEDWELLTEIRRARAGTEVLALLDEPSVAGYLRALSAGAVGAVPRNAPPRLLRNAFDSATQGRSILPVEVVRALSAGTAAAAPAAGQPSSRELDWLRELARGVTIARLAEQAGYSERMMFRLLRSTYGKLNAASRTEALMTARARGLL
ncbi:response regulator transcription factor [Actinoplanes sp. TBRC 11911]|uniref:response regulator transcription factor n=1 Tax=Actinoplanes sp. TBRC 11911 TaxID=2729386 RepID=UPI00145DF956|nr:response regulator transcription factor [Actinoplanes sp. TBRC 11911]NMO57747.1 response regulator transcription factor [Actinoplanes sp. TBRC 11911]